MSTAGSSGGPLASTPAASASGADGPGRPGAWRSAHDRLGRRRAVAKLESRPCYPSALLQGESRDYACRRPRWPHKEGVVVADVLRCQRSGLGRGENVGHEAAVIEVHMHEGRSSDESGQ